MFRKTLIAVIFFLYITVLYAEGLDTRITRIQYFRTDNSLEYEVIVYYDENGNITKGKLFDEYMRVAGYVDFERNAQGKTIKELNYDYNRQLYQYTIVEYSENKMSRKVFNIDDSPVGTWVDEYDSRGNLVSITAYNTSGEVWCVTKYTWINSRELKYESVTSDGQVIGSAIMRFNAGGQIVEKETFSGEGNKNAYIKYTSESGIMSQQSLHTMLY